MDFPEKNWHAAEKETRTIGERVSDAVTRAMGSWIFIITQTLFIVAWIIINVIGWKTGWDPYPFILLNLVFSTQAFYAAPIIMMSQNRQAERDREQAIADYQTNIAAKEEIEQVQRVLARIETAKLDRIIELLEKEQKRRKPLVKKTIKKTTKAL